MRPACGRLSSSFASRTEASGAQFEFGGQGQTSRRQPASDAKLPERSEGKNRP
jgi:hypothetical protein